MVSVSTATAARHALSFREDGRLVTTVDAGRRAVGMPFKRALRLFMSTTRGSSLEELAAVVRLAMLIALALLDVLASLQLRCRLLLRLRADNAETARAGQDIFLSADTSLKIPKADWLWKGYARMYPARCVPWYSIRLPV
jgi:hypothetical protein